MMPTRTARWPSAREPRSRRGGAQADGSVAGRGRNVFELPEGKIRRATGFWG
jgi:hypothetical protein